jgi:uncharacterized membrane protein YgcG
MPIGRCPYCKREQTVFSSLSIAQHCKYCHKLFKSSQDRSYIPPSRRRDSDNDGTSIITSLVDIGTSFDSSSGSDSGSGGGGFDGGGGGEFGGGGASGDF